MQAEYQHHGTKTPSCWLVDVEVCEEDVGTFVDALENISASFSCFKNEDKGSWTLKLYVENEYLAKELKQRVGILVSALNLKKLTIHMESLPDTDWVREVQRNYPPHQAGRFFIYASWHKDPVPFGTEPILIDPSMAFGTGDHETTAGCLEAITHIKEQQECSNILDIGCGSAILAIGAAKVWPDAKIIAADIDPVSVKISEENIAINQVKQHIRVIEADGYNHHLIKNQAPFDLILSNILAEPLIAFAADLVNSLAEGGFAVLSGLLTFQKEEVLAAHTKLGLKLVENISHKNWETLVLANIR